MAITGRKFIGRVCLALWLSVGMAWGKGVIRLDTKWENGILTMPCTINGLQLRFIFDTGASTVCISSTEALFMLKNGYLDETDIGGEVQTAIANGDIVDSTEIVLREVVVGGIALKNVRAIVSHEIDAPLLLGQTAIQKLGTIQIKDGEVTIVTDTAMAEEEEENYDRQEYLRKRWLVSRDGGYDIAEYAPIEAKLKFYKTEARRGNTDTMVRLGDLYALECVVTR